LSRRYAGEACQYLLKIWMGKRSGNIDTHA
jgi:hypothetical protein